MFKDYELATFYKVLLKVKSKGQVSAVEPLVDKLKYPPSPLSRLSPHNKRRSGGRVDAPYPAQPGGIAYASLQRTNEAGASN